MSSDLKDSILFSDPQTLAYNSDMNQRFEYYVNQYDWVFKRFNVPSTLCNSIFRWSATFSLSDWFIFGFKEHICSWIRGMFWQIKSNTMTVCALLYLVYGLPGDRTGLRFSLRDMSCFCSVYRVLRWNFIANSLLCKAIKVYDSRK